jgi:sigma-B regulation protein RsbU (phosphoserine phosphatase)
VSIFDDANQALMEDERPKIVSDQRWISDALFGPHRHYNIALYVNVDDPHMYGSLDIYLDTYPLALGFFERSVVVILSTLGLTLSLTFILFFVFQFLVNSPLASIVCDLLMIDPIKPEKTQLTSPPHHQTDELGRLVDAANALLRSIDEKATAREKLNEELEERVAKRTQELSKANAEIIGLNELLQEENLRMGAELDITRRIQQMVLPKPEELEQVEALDIACYMQPASEVGGDYYDVLQVDDKVKIGIGDVTGHGLESGVLMLMVQMAVRSLMLANVSDPKIFFSVINKALYCNAQRMDTEKNLTLALLDYANNTVRISGQHEEVLFVQQDGSVERVDTLHLGYSVGLATDIGRFVDSHELKLEAGEGLVLYTDGITEAFNAADEMYGLDRLCEVVSKHWQQTANEIKDAAIADVEAHMGEGQAMDDITLVVLKQK